MWVGFFFSSLGFITVVGICHLWLEFVVRFFMRKDGWIYLLLPRPSVPCALFIMCSVFSPGFVTSLGFVTGVGSCHIWVGFVAGLVIIFMTAQLVQSAKIT